MNTELYQKIENGLPVGRPTLRQETGEWLLCAWAELLPYQAHNYHVPATIINGVPTIQAVDIPFEYAVLQAKLAADARRQEIETAQVIVNTPSHGSVTISMTASSQANIGGLMNQIRAGTFHAIDSFLCNDAVFRTMQSADIEAIYAAGVAQKQAAFDWQRGVFELIDSAETVADLRNI